MVADLSDAARKEIGGKGGVHVESATDAAARAGLREGDIIVAVANVTVSNVQEFESVLAKLDKNKPLSVLFRRGEWSQYAVIRPQK